MVAKVATVLGDKNINITRMNVAQNRSQDDNISMMIINTGSVVEGVALKEISAIDGISEAKYINLNA